MRNLMPVRTRPGQRRTRGQSVVEFALLVPVLLFMLLIAVDFGRVFFSYIQLQNAAREAAAYGAASPTNQGEMLTRANQERNAQGQAGEGAFTLTSVCKDQAGTVIACSASPGGTGSGNTLTVTLQRQFSFLTPLINNLFAGGLTMSASTTTAVFGSAAGGGPAPSTTTCPGPTRAVFVITSSDLTVTVDPSGSLPDTVPCAISGYLWDFGWSNSDRDKAVGSSVPVSHTYPRAGTYTITLEVTNQGGSLTTTGVVTVPAPPPTPSPSPSASPSSSAGPSGDPSAAPTGSPSTSPSTSPSVAPSASPSPSTCTRPTVSFTWVPQGDRVVDFSDLSSAPAGCPIQTWFWDFGDSTNSNAINPRHTFPNNGNHSVTLTVTNSAGSATSTRAVKP